MTIFVLTHSLINKVKQNKLECLPRCVIRVDFEIPPNRPNFLASIYPIGVFHAYRTFAEHHLAFHYFHSSYCTTFLSNDFEIERRQAIVVNRLSNFKQMTEYSAVYLLLLSALVKFSVKNNISCFRAYLYSNAGAYCKHHKLNTFKVCTFQIYS